MSEGQHYSASELARLAGVTQRTIRYYTSEGLLPPPETRGRYASYSGEHLRRLRRIAELKAAYLPLSVIRERLGADEAAAGAEAGGAGRGELRYTQRAATPAGQPRPKLIAESGAIYMHAPRAPEGSGEPFHLTPAPLQTGRVDFFPGDPGLLGEPDEGVDEGLPATGRWQRIVLARGVELHVREPISARRRERLDALIAAARDALAAEE